MVKKIFILGFVFVLLASIVSASPDDFYKINNSDSSNEFQNTKDLGSPTDVTNTFTALQDGIITQMKYSQFGVGITSSICTVIYNSNIIATASGGTGVNDRFCNFALSDYNETIPKGETFQVRIVVTGGTGNLAIARTGFETSYSGDLFSWSSQKSFLDTSFNSVFTFSSITEIFQNIFLYDQYRNTSLQNFTIDISNSTSTENIITTDSVINYTRTNDLYNISFYNITGNTFFNTSYIGINSSDINNTFYANQTMITFNFRSITPNASLAGTFVNVTDTTYGYIGGSNTGSLTFSPVSLENLEFQFSGEQISLTTQNFTFSTFENGSYDIYMGSLINVSFFDEATLEPFDLTGINETKVEIFCNDLTTIESTNLLVNQININGSCTWNKIKVTMTYESDITGTYYRTIRYDDIVDPTNIKMYFINLNNDTSIFNTFILYDIFNEFDNKSLIIQKITPDGLIYIHSEFADIRDVVSAYLIQNDQYIFTVKSSTQPDRLFGTYNADTAGEFTMRLFDLDLSSEQIYTSTGVGYTTYLDGSLIRSAYNDTTVQGVVTSGTFIVRNGSETGPILYTSTSTNTAAIFSYSIPTLYENESLYTNLYISVTEGTDISHSVFLQQNTDIEEPSDFDTPDFLKWTLFLMLLAFAMTATIKSQDVISLLLVALGGFLNYIGWVAIGYPVLSVGAVLALINLFMGDEK